MLAEKNKGNPAEFEKILDRFFSEEEIRDVGINFQFLDDDQKFCAMSSIRKIDPSKIDSIEIRGYHWSTPMSGSEGYGIPNKRFLEFMHSALVRNKLTSLSMSCWLITHRGSPPPDFFISLEALKKLDLTFRTPNGRSLFFYATEKIDEIKIDFGEVESQGLRVFALKSTKNLIITGESAYNFTANSLEKLKFSQKIYGGFPDEIIVQKHETPELIKAAVDFDMKIKFQPE